MPKFFLALALAVAFGLAPADAQQISGRVILSSQADGLYNANAEESLPFPTGEGTTGPLLKVFSINAIATGVPTTCTWNLFCTNKQWNDASLVAGDFNSLGEVSGTPSDLSCLPANAQRLTRFVDMPYSTCKVRLVTIGGGTTPAVKFYRSGVAQ